MSDTPAEARLRSLPWHALDGLKAALAPPIDEVLAGAPAERVLKRFLRAHPELDDAQRRMASEAIFGVGLWRRRLAAVTGATTAPTALHTLIHHLGLGEGTPPADWPARFSVPDWLADALVDAVGDEAPHLAAALDLPGPVCLRANRRRMSRDALAHALRARGVDTAPGQLAPDALIVTSPRPNIYGLAADLPGDFEVQDEGSQVLGNLVDAGEGDAVLDLCAGAGGKTLLLAAAVGPAGRVHATDVDLSRLERLRLRAARAGVSISIHGAHPPESLRVPRVLVDAPCSELGALRRGPDLRWRMRPADFEALPELQLEILRRGLSHLAPGGRLVYATCTLRRQENDDVVDAILTECPEATLVRPDAPAGTIDARGFLRLCPHRHGTDGFFAAVLTKR